MTFFYLIGRIKNLFLLTGPMTPKHYVPDSPKKKQSFFPEDTSPLSESDFEDGDSTFTYAAKVTTKKHRKFTFRNFPVKTTDDKKETSPSSSPLNWPTPPSPIIISSDEDLECSMVELERQVSLEMIDSSE